MVDNASTPANSGLHVLILDPAFHDGAAWGPTRTYDLAQRLVGSGYRVTVLTSTWGMDSPEARSTVTRDLAGIAVRARRVSRASGMHLDPADTARYVRWAVWQMWLVPDVDVVIAVTASPSLLIAARLFSVWRGIPLMGDARDVAPDPLPADAEPRARVWAAVRNTYRRAALMLPRRIFAASQAVMDSLTADGVKAERQIQTALGCDTRLFDFPAGRDNTFLAQFPDLAGRPLLVFAGRFTADRDLTAVVNLGAALREWSPDVTVILCGEGPSRAALVEHARSIGVLDSAVRILAPVPRRHLPDLLAAAAMVLSVPRRNDTAGGFFDALAAGRPVLAFGNSWQRTLVENRGVGFGLPGGDPRSVAREIVEILRDGDGLRRAGQQASALAAGRFNLDRIVAEQRAAIEALVAEIPRAEVLRRRALFAKRLTDIGVSAAALIVLSPLIFVLAVIVAFKIGWPPFVGADRVGLKGRVFKSFGFRTLADIEEPSGALLPEESRTTPLGDFLRASGLAALPELANVLRGAMSLVGPAPLPPSYTPYYTPAQRRRHEMRPGLTGLAQVEGQEARGWEEIFALDAAYIDRFSYALDCKILLRSMVLLLQGVGVTNARGLPAFDAIMARREGAEDI